MADTVTDRDLESRVRKDRARFFRARLFSDSMLVLAGHTVLMALVAVLVWAPETERRLEWWMAAVFLATVARAVSMRKAGDPGRDDRETVASARNLVLLQGLAWGGGAGALLPVMPIQNTAILLVAFAGIVASALNTLGADPPSFFRFLITVYAPVLIGLLVSGVDRIHLVTAALVFLFIVAVTVIHRRSNRALTEHLRTAILLSISEEAKAREGAFLAGLLRSTPIAIAVLDDDQRIRSVNPQFEALFGYSSAEAVGRQLDDLIIPETARAEGAELERRVRGGEALHGDVERRAKDGRAILVRLSAAAVRETSSGGVVALYEDVTAEKQAQEALRTANEAFHALIEASPLMICKLDREGRVQSWNSAAERLFGWKASEVLGLPLPTVPPEQRAGFAALHDRLMQGEVVTGLEVPGQRRDGSMVDISLFTAPLRDAAGHVEGAMSVVMDISTRKEAERALRESEARFRHVAESNIVGICFWDTRGGIHGANDELLRLLGYTRKDLAAGRITWSAVWPSEHGGPMPLEALLAGDDSRLREQELTRKDGSRVAALVGVGPLCEPGYRGVAFLLDITERKRAEEAMREARELAERTAEARTMFLANMSHEIRTPMNAVLGMTQIVLETDLTTEQRHSLELVHSSAEQLLAVLDDILDFSKIHGDHLEIEAIAFDLEALVRSTASLLATRLRGKQIEVIPDVAVDRPTAVRGDPTRLRQILTNLIGNAIKFTESGEVVVGVRSAPMEDGRTGIRFSVRDTGIGIPPDRLEHLFAEFTQVDGSTSRRYGGTGLGLAIAQQLVRLMGGKGITVTSEPGRGTEFVFTLPLPSEPESPAAQSSPETVLAGRSLLVVDANETNRRVFRGLLAAEGARVEDAVDARSALAALRNMRDAGHPAAIAIIDARLPGRSGFDLVSDIRADSSLAQTPLLVLIPAGELADGARCRELGVNGSLTKPVSRHDLVEAVGAIIGGAGSFAGPGQESRHETLRELRRPLRILLAEDNPVNQEVAATMLRKRGHQVDTAANGREAVAVTQRAEHDLVLMDIQMPEMDGFEATAAIRALPGGAGLRILALTAHALSGERERCLALGMNGYLTKPFKARELFAAIEGWESQEEPAPSAGGTDAPTPVNIETLRGQLRDAGVEEALDGILDTFLASAPERVTALRECLTTGSAMEVSRAAHALKSSAGAIGAASLAALLARIEEAGRTDALGDRQSLGDQVRDAADAVYADLRSYRGSEA